MPYLFSRKHILFIRKLINSWLVLILSLSFMAAPIQAQQLANLPAPGQMVLLTAGFQPPVLRGMAVHPKNPLLFDFIVDRGQDHLNNDLLKEESTKLIKYFLASMTIPDQDAWVNLSPYEASRIIPDALGQTEMGRQMLEQDYVLKQIAASLTNPEQELGQRFWSEVKSRAQQQFGTTEVPLNTFNKVWIVPDGATVVEKDGFAYIVESKLKVLVDEDYQERPLQAGSNQVSKLSTEVFREMIIPELNKEINEGKHFAPTRQVYQSVILAAWYKKALKDSLLGKVYVDKNKVNGVESDVSDIKEKVYEQYLAAFKKGVYSVIKEEQANGEVIPRKYFSGGENFLNLELNRRSDVFAVRSAASAIIAAGDRFAVVASSAAESRAEEELRTGLSAASIAAGIVPKKFQDIFSDAVAVSVGVNVGFTNENQLYVEGFPNTAIMRKNYSQFAQALNLGNRVEIREKIFLVFSRAVNARFNEWDESSVRRTIDVFMDELAQYNTPSVEQTVDGLTINYQRIPEKAKGVFAYLTPMIKQTIAQMIKRNPALAQSREIEVEKMPVEKTGTQFFFLRWAGNQYVIKVRPAPSNDLFSTIKNQAALLKQLNAYGGDRHIVKLMADGTVEGFDYLVMDYLSGLNLKERIESEGPMVLSDTVKVAIELAQGVQFAHNSGVIIFDAVAENIQLGDDLSVVLHDFDKAGSYFRDFSNQDDARRFVTEEDIKSDITTIGETIYFLATGALPSFKGWDNPALIENMELLRILKRSIGTIDVQQYRFVKELVYDLVRLQETLNAQPKPVASSSLSDEFNHPDDKKLPDAKSAGSLDELAREGDELLATGAHSDGELVSEFGARDAFVFEAEMAVSGDRFSRDSKLDAFDRALHDSQIAPVDISQLTGEGLLRWLYTQGLVRDVSVDKVPDIEDHLKAYAFELAKLVVVNNQQINFKGFVSTLVEQLIWEDYQNPIDLISKYESQDPSIATLMKLVYRGFKGSPRAQFASYDFLRVLSLTRGLLSAQRALTDLGARLFSAKGDSFDFFDRPENVLKATAQQLKVISDLGIAPQEIEAGKKAFSALLSLVITRFYVIQQSQLKSDLEATGKTYPSSALTNLVNGRQLADIGVDFIGEVAAAVAKEAVTKTPVESIAVSISAQRSLLGNEEYRGYRDSLNTNLRALRTARGMKQNDLVQQANRFLQSTGFSLSQTDITAYESDGHHSSTPRLWFLPAVAQALDVNVGELWPQRDLRVLNFIPMTSSSAAIAKNQAEKVSSVGLQTIPSVDRNLGGIDFDSSKLNLQIKRDGYGVPLPLPQQDLKKIDIKGLYPVIINIQPVNIQTLPILGQLQPSTSLP